MKGEHENHPHSKNKKTKKNNYEKRKIRQEELRLGAVKKKSIYNNALQIETIPYPESNPQCIFVAMEMAKDLIKSLVYRYWKSHGSLRWQISLDVEMVKVNQEDEVLMVDTGYFTTNMNTLLIPENEEEFTNYYDTVIDQLYNRLVAFQRKGSGWVLKRIHAVNVFLHEFRPFTGTSYISTPTPLRFKRSIINVENKKDFLCFKYAVAGIYNDKIIKEKKHLTRPSSYKPFLDNFNWDGLDFSKGINFSSDLNTFETNNDQYALNVLLTLNEGRKKELFPLRISKQEGRTPINLLFIYSERYKYGHWTFIKDVDTLCSRSVYNKGKTCLRCLRNFTGQNRIENYNRHLPDCQLNKPLAINFPVEDKIRFKNFHHSLKVPFVIYADFESILSEEKIEKVMKKIINTPNIDLHGLIEEDLEEPEGPSPPKISKFMESVTQHHIPCGYSILCQAPPSVQHHFPQKVYCGKDVGKNFIQSLFDIQDKIKELKEEKNATKDVSNMLPMTKEELEAYDKAKNCFICKKKISYTGSMDEFMSISKEDKAKWDKRDQLGPKVRDHDHWSSKYRGAAHLTCNLNYRETEKIPIFFHNGKRYDNHFLLQFAAKYTNEEFRRNNKVIGNTMEQFTAIFLGNTFVVKDSFNFLSKSLESLVSTMCKSQEKNDDDKKVLFKNLYKFFQSQNVEEEAFNLLLSKQHYCYEYMDSFEKFSHGLPPKEKFNSSLKQTSLTDEEYAHVENIFKIFNMKTMKDLHNFYVQTDVALLADVFENFRNMSLKIYELDPAHYVTTPSLSWDAALKCTEVELEIIKDIEMVNFIDRGMYGGFSAVLEQYSKANNSEIEKYGKIYHSDQPQKHILCVDNNNQYGWVCI